MGILSKETSLPFPNQPKLKPSLIIKIVVGLFIALILFLLFRSKKIKSGLEVPDVFHENWQLFLLKEVNFYASMADEDKVIFEADNLSFLKRVKITGIKTTVDE